MQDILWVDRKQCLKSILKDLQAYILVIDSVSRQSRNLRFSNVDVSTDNSLKYPFPDTGLFEIIARISSPDAQALRAFDIIVPKNIYLVYCLYIRNEATFSQYL